MNEHFPQRLKAQVAEEEEEKADGDGDEAVGGVSLKARRTSNREKRSTGEQATERKEAQRESESEREREREV